MKGYTKTPVVNLAQATGSGIGKSGSAATAAVNGAITPGATHVFRVDSDLSDVCYFPLAAAVTNSVTSTIFSGSAASTQIGLFQNDFLPFVTTNGGADASIVYNFQDKTLQGSYMSAYMYQCRNNLGRVCFGHSVRILVNGADYAAGFNVLSPAYDTVDMYGRHNYIDINGTQNQTRGDFDTSIMVYNENLKNMSRFTQLLLTIPGLGNGIVATNTVQLTVTSYFTPDFKV